MQKTTLDNEVKDRIRQWRRIRRALHQSKEARRRLDDMISTLEEEAGEVEFDVAILLQIGGPVDLDGRRYSHEVRDGCDCVSVTAVPVGEAEITIYPQVGTANCPEEVP